MTLLISLPAEIIIKILKLVALKSSQSLRNLCLTSKALNQISSPWLVYRWTNSKDSPEPSLQCFALHLLKHPELRNKVRIVDFGVLRFVATTAESSAENCNPDLVALAECLRTDVESSSFHGWRDMLEAIKRGCEDAISVAVLAWCKQITHLNMTLPRADTWSPNSFNDWGLKFANEACGRNVEIHQQHGETKGLPLAQLQYVELLPIDPSRAVYFEWVIPFLHHPKVKSLMAWRAEEAKVYWYIEKGHYSNRYTVVGEKNVSNVEELMLMTAAHSNHSLSELLSIPRRLKKLTLQPCTRCYHSNMPDYETLAEIIGLCRESLEELDLICNPIRMLVVLLRDPVAQNVYRQCIRLRRLACPMDGLLSNDSEDNGETREITIDIERLPQSIEYLKPRRRLFVEKWYSNRRPVKPWIDGFIALLKQAAPDGRLPNLRVLDLTDTFVDDPDTDGIDEMKELAKNQGVELLMAQRQICGSHSDFLEVKFPY